MRALFVALCLLGLSACSTTPVPLTYNPGATTMQASKGEPLVSVAPVADQRKNGKNWLGAIRGGYGNPLKTLETTKPVAEVVRDTMNAGLEARGLRADSGAKFVLQVTMNRFDCSQLVRREATADFLVSLTDNASNKEVFRRTVHAERVNGSLISFDVGVFASVEDLRKLANEALQDAIDQTLDDPNFRASLI